jgi:7-carboxy-7-deazaguanine synthase
MFGKNPIRAPDAGDGATLDVKHIFPTLQGEGPYVGHPSVFVRLGGCNLACSFCDTDFEGFTTLSVDDIITQVKTLSQGEGAKRVRNLVVITGGEPLRQNIAPLCELLLADGFKVQIETNGTLYRSLPKEVAIICSPKNTGQGYFKIREDLLPYVQAFKFILSKHDAKYHDVGDVGQSIYHTPVYVQPMDEYDVQRNAENLTYANQIAQTQGYILSLQTHKIVGIE